MDGAARFDEINLIADPLYGYIEITNGTAAEPGERALLDNPWLQRLRRIHQLQSAWWVFPTAEHSRFAHLLGAMHLSSRFAHRLDASLRTAFPEAPSPACVEETLRMAGLLHDVGHGPFGHFCDVQVLLPRWGIDHEDVSRHLVCNQLADHIAALRASPSGHFDSGEQVDPQWVAWLMAPADMPGYDPPPWLRACKPVLCGPATVDNLDYVVRDAYMCGVSIGPVDVHRIIHYSFVHGDTVVLHTHGTAALEMFLVARLYMYMQVYMHRTGRRFDLSMTEVFPDTVDRLLGGDPRTHPDDWLGLTDWAVLEAVRRWRQEPGGTEERRLGDAWGRIMARELPWELAYDTLARRDTDLSSVQRRLLAELPAGTDPGHVVVDVASARIAPHNPMAEDGMVAIYDPLHGSVERSRTDELVARLPQYNQLVRVFTREPALIPAVHAAARRVLGGLTVSGG